MRGSEKVNIWEVEMEVELCLFGSELGNLKESSFFLRWIIIFFIKRLLFLISSIL